MNTYFYRKYPTRPTKIQSILIKLTFRQNLYGFLSNISGTILCQKKSNAIKNAIQDSYPLFKNENPIQSYQKQYPTFLFTLILFSV